MSAGTENLLIEQGATFILNIQIQNPDLTAFNLTGCSIAAQIRKTPSDPNILQSFTCLIIDAVNGLAQIALTNVETSAIPVNKAKDYHKILTRYAYDVEVTLPDTSVIRLIEGDAMISPEVTI